MAARYWLSALAACGAISVSLAQSAEAAPQGFKGYSEDAFEAFTEQVGSGEVLIAKGGPDDNACKGPGADKNPLCESVDNPNGDGGSNNPVKNCKLEGGDYGTIDPTTRDCAPTHCVANGYNGDDCEAYKPENIDGEDIEVGGKQCFENDGKSVIVPKDKECSTDDETETATYESLVVEENATLNLGGNLIFERDFSALDVGENASLQGDGGLIKKEGAESTVVVSGNGAFAYTGKNFVNQGVLEIKSVDGLGSADAGTRVAEGAVLRITVSGEPTPQGSTNNDAQINEEITLAGGELFLNGNYIDLKGGVVLYGEGTNSTIRVKDGSTEVFARSVISGDGGLIKDGEGFLRLGGDEPQTYGGETIINAGELRFANTTSTPSTTDVTVNQDATLRLMGGPETSGGLNTVRSITGEGRIVLNTDEAHLSVNVPSGENPNFKGSILGGPNANSLEGTFIKDGDGKQILSGKNSYGSLIVEGGQLDINGENIDTKGLEITDASVSLNLSKELSVKEGTALWVSGHDINEEYGPREPGEEMVEGTLRKISNHAAPVIRFDSGKASTKSELNIKANALLAASFVDAMPADIELYKNNCLSDAEDKTCYSMRPQITFRNQKSGEIGDIMINNGFVVGPSETSTGNHLQLRFLGGDDKLENQANNKKGSWLGCLMFNAADEGHNGYKFGNTCKDADDQTGKQLSASGDVNLNRNYNVNVFMGSGNDEFVNSIGGYLRGSFNGESGDDELTNSGVIRGNISMGRGSDTVEFQGGGAENDGKSRGVGVLDDRLILGNSLNNENDTSSADDQNKLNLFGNSVISYRNSLGWGVQEADGQASEKQCGGKKSTTGRSDYGCRWDDGGYDYLAIVGSKGKDNIWVKKKFNGTKPVTVWGSVELRASNDALRLEDYKDDPGYGADLQIVGDLDLGQGDSQIISLDQGTNFSVRAIHGDNVDFTISDSATATLGGDPELGVFEHHPVDGLGSQTTLSTYSGTTRIDESATLFDVQAWILSRRASYQVDGELNLKFSQDIGQLLSSEDTGEVIVGDGVVLSFGKLNTDVDYYGDSSGNGELHKHGTKTTTIHGTLNHTGRTSIRNGTLRLGSDGKLRKETSLIANGGSRLATIDLGGTSQDVDKITLHSGALRNGSLSADNKVIVSKSNSKNLDNIIQDIDGESGALVEVDHTGIDDVKLQFLGDSKFKSLSIDRALVEIAEGASLTLSEGVQGGDFDGTAVKPASSLHDKLDVQGSLTLGGSIDLDAGNDLIRIGNRASINLDVGEKIDGGSGDFDVFWNQNASLAFDSSNVQGFEIVSLKGEGLAYLGDKASLIVTAASRDVDDSVYQEYGSIVSTSTNNELNFSSNSNIKDFEPGITVGLLQLDGDSTIHLRQGSLDIAALQSNSKGKTHEFILGAPVELSSDAPLKTLRESMVTPGSGADLDQVASGRLSIDASDQSIASIKQKGGLWSYEGDYSSTDLSGQGVVVVGDGNDAAESSATFKSITADGSRRLLVGARKDGVLSVTNGIHDSWSSDSGFLNASKASLISNGAVVLGVSGGKNPSTYQGLTVVRKDGSIKTLENDAISSQSPTLVRGLLQIGEASDSGVSQNFGRRLIVGQSGSIQNGDLSITSLANAGDVQIDSLTINNGMKRLLDVLSDRRELDQDAPIRRIKAQGSLKNLGGNIEISGELKYQDNDDAADGHALINVHNLREVIQYLNGDRSGEKPQPGTLTAQKITMGKNRDIISNSGTIKTTIRKAGETSINLGGGNDLILNRGSFDVGQSIIDGGEKLEISGSILNRDTRTIKGLNIFRQGHDRLSILANDPTANFSGLEEEQLKNFAAIKLDPGGDWIFPQGHDCLVKGDGRTFSEDKTDCVGIVGQRNADQFLKITNGANVETGVMELGRSSNNTIEVLDGSLTAGLIDGVVGSERVSANSGDIIFDRSVNNSYNSLVVGDDFSSASVKAQAIHNIASIYVFNGSLDADLLHATDLEYLGQNPELLIGSSTDPSSLMLNKSTSLVEQISSNAVKGSLRVDETEGYSQARQLGGMWGYEGDFGDIDLDAQGIVTTTRSADDLLIKEDNEQDDIDEVTFKSITVAGERHLLVGARQDGKLTILEGLHAASDEANSGTAAILNNGEMVLGDIEGESDETASTYRGATIIMKDGSLQTLYNDAISPESPTLVRGRLAIGNESSGSIQQSFARRLLVGNEGTIQNGDLSITSLANAGDVQIDSLTINNGMKRLLDVLDDRGVLDEDSPLRRIKAQGSLKNLGGTIEIAGELKYQDNDDATDGHALINIRNLRDVAKGNKPVPGTLAAEKITMGSNNDVILNSGIIQTTTRNTGETSINLRSGNDLILNRGTFDIGQSIIDGGEKLVLELNQPVQGLNIFRQGVDPRSDSSSSTSGLKESQLVNFAAIKLDAEEDQWIFPQGQDCQVRGESKVFDENTQCAGITGRKEKDQEIVITNGARVEAGVVSLGRGSTNIIRLEEGSLRAVLVEGGNELRDRFRSERGKVKNDLPTQKETIFLGQSGTNQSGELIVGGIVDIEAIHQLGGTWSYAVNSSEDDFGVFPDTKASGTIVVKTTDLSRDLNDTTSVSRATFQSIDGEGNDLSIEVASDASLGVIDGIHGDNTALTTKGEVNLSGNSSYGGDTIIQDGATLYAENNSALSENSSVDIEAGGTLNLQGFDNTIASLSGDGDLVLNAEIFSADSSADEITGADLVIQPTQFEAGIFAGTIFDGDLDVLGSVTKSGKGSLVLSGVNTYSSPTFIQDGKLIAGSSSALSPNSDFTLSGEGVLDLSTYPRGESFRFDQNERYSSYIKNLTIYDNSRLTVSSFAPVKIRGQLSFNQGEIAVFLDSGVNSAAPIQIDDNGKFVYGNAKNLGSANLYMVVSDDNARQQQGTWNVIDGEVDNAGELARHTYLLVPALQSEQKNADDLVEINGVVYRVAQFDGVDQPLDEAALSDVRLEKGSLKMVVAKKSLDDLKDDLNGDDDNSDGDGVEDNDGVVDERDPDADGDGILDEKDPDDDGDGELDQLPGCEVGDDLCDVISDISGDEDEARAEEEEDAAEVIDALHDGLQEEELDLPLTFDYGQLARLVGSGLAPRNVDAAGRGLALHNNLLVDAMFERQSLRQFEQLVSEQVVEQQSVVEEEEAVIEESSPAQPLWLKTEGFSDGEAAEYVEGAVEGVEVADAAVNGDEDVAIEAEEAAVVVEFDGVRLVDQQDDELDLAKRDGVSAWVKGFGGNSRADESSILYNDYDLSAYGTSFGVDVALSESFQIGAYANYGDLNVNHRSGDTGGGSWNPEGWGGGLTAQYSTRHFYVQGLLGASEFSGEQSRNILRINEDLGGNTARGDKSVTSYLGALRIGAPFKTGGVVLEPQGQVVWTRNHEQGFSETGGTEKNLRLKYKSRTTNFAETELGMKLSVPIRTGDRGLLVPSVRAAWLADWNQANEGQEIGYKFTKKTANFDSQLGTETGALIEAGLDYTVQNFNGISVKLYGRGGMEFWASDRGTTWRASGGVTFQF